MEVSWHDSLVPRPKFPSTNLPRADTVSDPCWGILVWERDYCKSVVNLSQADYLQGLLNGLDMGIMCQQPAARLAQFVGNWARVTQDQWVLEAIQGYCLDFVKHPTQSRVPSTIQLPRDQRELVSIEVAKLREKGAISQAPPSPAGFISQLFLVPKKGGGQRPVINLKALNRFIRWEHFQMEGLHMLPDILMADDWMVKLDLKDAYLQVPIHPAHHQFLRFQWEGTTYHFQCLPFGLTSAPRVFTKIMRPVVGFLRQVGIRLLIYLDDMLILHQERDPLQCLVGLVIQFF